MDDHCGQNQEGTSRSLSSPYTLCSHNAATAFPNHIPNFPLHIPGGEKVIFLLNLCLYYPTPLCSDDKKRVRWFKTEKQALLLSSDRVASFVTLFSFVMFLFFVCLGFLFVCFLWKPVFSHSEILGWLSFGCSVLRCSTRRPTRNKAAVFVLKCEQWKGPEAP